MNDYSISQVAPGTIRIGWAKKGGFGQSLIWGEAADDLMERYRSAPDEEHRQMILRAAVEGEV